MDETAIKIARRLQPDDFPESDDQPIATAETAIQWVLWIVVVGIVIGLAFAALPHWPRLVWALS